MENIFNYNNIPETLFGGTNTPIESLLESEGPKHALGIRKGLDDDMITSLFNKFPSNKDTIKNDQTDKKKNRTNIDELIVPQNQNAEPASSNTGNSSIIWIIIVIILIGALVIFLFYIFFKYYSKQNLISKQNMSFLPNTNSIFSKPNSDMSKITRVSSSD